MREILKEVVNEQGLQILQTPAMLRAKLEEKGDDRSDALLWELILTACPSVADVAVQPELSRAEVNTVIGAVTKTTMLSASLVRRMVQQLLDAAQVKLSPVPRFLIFANGRHGGACSVEDQREGEVLQAALASLETDTETALSDLQTLSQAGNAYASYQLGLYYSSHEMEGMDTQQVAQNFFNCAAQQGYGPGYGALADHALNGRRKNLRRAAQYFGYPTSLAGRDGKRWSKNAADLLAYREQNVRSGRQTLLLVVVTLVITLLAGICSPREFAMAVPALVLELGCGVRCVLEASLEGLSFSFKDNLAVFCIGLLLLVGLSAVRKYFPNAALNVLRYAILILMQLLAFEGMFQYLLNAQLARQLWLFVPPVLFSGLLLARELRDGEEKSQLHICVLASVLYAFLTPVVLAAVSSGWSDLCSRVGKLTHLGWPMVAGAVLLPALTLEKGAQKQSIYRAARLLVWAAYILLLNWRAGAMRLDADDCWLISVLGVPVAGAVYELLEQKGQVTAKWYHAPLALLALLTVSMAALQDMRFILLLVGLGVLWWICARLGTLAGKYKVVMQGFWGAAAMLLLAASRQLGTREAIPANWLVALALLGVSWCVLTVFLSVRYRAANAMEIYPEEYSTVYRLCNVVPLLAAVLAALCVIF